MKNQILLNHYYLSGELQEKIQRFVMHYHHERYHESLDNLTPTVGARILSFQRPV